MRYATRFSLFMHLSIVWPTPWTPGMVRHLSNVRRILLYHDAHMRQNYDELQATNDGTSVKIMTHQLLILTVILTHIRHGRNDTERVFPDLRSGSNLISRHEHSFVVAIPFPHLHRARHNVFCFLVDIYDRSTGMVVQGFAIKCPCFYIIFPFLKSIINTL